MSSPQIITSMNRYIFAPPPYQYQEQVVFANVTQRRVEVGIVPALSGSEVMLNSLRELDSAFSEMTKTLKSRNTQKTRKRISFLRRTGVIPGRKKTFCSVKNCESPSHGWGFCNKHYIRLKKFGDPLGSKNGDVLT